MADHRDERRHQERLVASAEWKLLGRIETFGMSVRMLERNAEELTRHLRYLIVDPRSILLMGVAYKEKRDQHLEEVVRLLHNFVAAVATVVDHSRALYNELYEPSGIFPDYKGEVDRRFAQDPLSRFVGGLRNYFLHRVLPSVVYIENSDLTRMLALRKKDLLEHDRWHKQARKYLESAPDDVDISAVVDAYMSSVREFYQWFAERQQAIHANCFASVQDTLDSIAHARGPRMIAHLASAIEAIERGNADPRHVLGEWFDPVKERGQFDAMADDLPAWTDNVLNVLEQRYAPIPADLAARYRRAAAARTSSETRDSESSDMERTDHG